MAVVWESPVTETDVKISSTAGSLEASPDAVEAVLDSAVEAAVEAAFEAAVEAAVEAAAEAAVEAALEAAVDVAVEAAELPQPRTDAATIAAHRTDAKILFLIFFPPFDLLHN